MVQLQWVLSQPLTDFHKPLRCVFALATVLCLILTHEVVITETWSYGTLELEGFLREFSPSFSFYLLLPGSDISSINW